MEKEILVTASYYKQKYYFNPKFDAIPAEIRNEIRALCIMTAEKIHGVLTLGFYRNGDIFFEASGEETDYEYDEIGAQLEIKEIKREKMEMFASLRLWYLMYQTKYGEVFREILILVNNENKTQNEIVDMLCEKYGQEIRDTIVEIVNTIS